MTNIAVVVLDTVRYDSFLEAFDWLNGHYFTRAYSTSHWTIPAHASLFTGQYPSSVDVHGHDPALDCPEQTLAEAFREAGYRTRCLSANAQLNQYEGWERGFEHFDRTANLGRTDDEVFDWEAHIERTSPGIGRHLTGLFGCISRDVDTWRSLRYGLDLVRTPSYDGGAAAVRDRLREMSFEDQEFLFVNLMDAHTPYRPPPGESDPVNVVVADALADEIDDPARLRAAYHASISHLAARYREIHELLREGFDYVITLSDHGELLGEHGLWNHSVSLHPELVHVPLVISGQAVTPAVSHDVVNLLDIHRTVAALADVPIESNGRNLLEPVSPRDLRVESHGLLPFHRGQFERKGLSTEEYERWRAPLCGFLTPGGAYCYEATPSTVRTLGDVDAETAERRLDIVRSHLEVPASDGSQPDVTDEVKSRLEELGYA